jgi:hypothetical protein
MEEALPFQSNHKNKGIKREKNPECKCYDYVDLIRLVQTFSEEYVLKKIKGRVII